MRYAQIRKMDISNGEGIGISLFVQGCPLHCKGCFQPETWDFNSGQDFTDKELNQIYKLLGQPHITRCSFLGGEPLAPQHIMEMAEIVIRIAKKFPRIELWLWTGYTKEQLQERIQKAFRDWPNSNDDIYLRMLLEKIDYLIAGPFVEEEKDLTLQWRGSRNQEVINMYTDGEWIYV